MLFPAAGQWCPTHQIIKNAMVSEGLCIPYRLLCHWQFFKYNSLLFVGNIWCSAASRLVHVYIWSSAANTTFFMWMSSWLDWETLGWLIKLITSFVWLLSLNAIIRVSEVWQWKDIVCWSCFVVQAPVHKTSSFFILTSCLPVFLPSLLLDKAITF